MTKPTSQEKLCDGPVGTALIGLWIGRSLTWKTPGGERRQLSALSVASLIGTDAMPSVRRILQEMQCDPKLEAHR